MGRASLQLRAACLLRALVVCAALAGAGGGVGLHAQPTSGDAVAKAKFTLTLARFVQWPASARGSDGTPLRICVMHGSAALGAAFAALEGQRVAGHPVQVVTNPRDPAGCGLLFIDASAAHGSAAVIAAVAGAPLLTLGAIDGFVSQGGMVELANVDDTLRFDVNLKALRSARLDLSSQVLNLARQVRN